MPTEEELEVLKDAGRQMDMLMRDIVDRMLPEEEDALSYIMGLIWDAALYLNRALEELKDVSPGGNIQFSQETAFDIVFNALKGEVPNPQRFASFLRHTLRQHYKHRVEGYPETFAFVETFLDAAINAAIEGELLSEYLPKAMQLLLERLDQVAAKVAQRTGQDVNTIKEILQRVPPALVGFVDMYVNKRVNHDPGLPIEFVLGFLREAKGGFLAIALYALRKIKEERPDLAGVIDEAEDALAWELHSIMIWAGAAKVVEEAPKLLRTAMQAIRDYISGVGKVKNFKKVIREMEKDFKAALKVVNEAYRECDRGELDVTLEKVKEAIRALDDIYEKKRSIKGINWGKVDRDLDAAILNLEDAADRLEDFLRPDAIGDRDDASLHLQEELSKLTVRFEGRELTIDDILEIAKGELRRAFGNDKIAFAVPVKGGVTEAALGYIERVEKMLENWLFGKERTFDFFLNRATKIKEDEGMRERLQRDLLNFLSERAGEFAALLMAGASASEFKKFITDLLQEFISTSIPQEYFRVPIGDAIAYLRGINVIAGNLATLAKRIATAEVKGNWLVYYISTDLEDYTAIGTSVDANPNSCFWTGLGKHSIPSILVATNVAVCYVYMFDNEDALREMGVEPPEQGIVKFTPKLPPWATRADVIGRTLIIVNPSGRITKQEGANTYITYDQRSIANLVWGILNSILQKEFGGVRLTPTNWAYRMPSA